MGANITVRTGPQEYAFRESILDSLPERLHSLKIKKVLIVHGTVSWKKARPFLKGLYNSGTIIHEYLFSGEASSAAIEKLVRQIEEEEVDAVLAVGGGKIMDTVKYAAYKAKVDAVMIPTLASNCAPWTPVAVVYSEEGVFESLDLLPRQVALLLVEPELIVDAPADYFVAGMADTLAKWYESDAILSRQAGDSGMLFMARQAAAYCRDIILAQGEEALREAESGTAGAAFRAVAEAIIAISGLVGGFGDELARTTIAHEIHDALTVFPQAHSFLHGHKVGYGILVQLAVEGNWQEIERLLPLYREMGIPASWKELQIPLTKENAREISTIASREGLPVHHLPYPIDAAVLEKAMHELEKYVLAKEK